MAIKTFYLYPTSDGDSAYLSGSYADVDDPQDASDGVGSWLRLMASNAGATRAAYACFGLTAPESGVTINWVRVHLIFATTSYTNFGPDSEAFIIAGVRPANSATYYDVITPTIVDAGGRATVSSYSVTNLPRFSNSDNIWRDGTGWCHAYWQHATNPVTALSWTVGDLQNLIVAVWADGAKGSPGAGTNLPGWTGNQISGLAVTGCYVEVNANVAAASIEAQRLNLSSYLRLFRGETEEIAMDLPPHAATLRTGDVVSIAHELGPDPDGAGWGLASWQRHYAIVLSREIDLINRRVRLIALDVSRFLCGLWFPGISDLAYTEEGQGIPYLDAGGGRSYTRYATNAGDAKTKGYVQRQASDSLYCEVPEDKEKWSPLGLACFRESYAALKNSSFSQGAGAAVFDDWTSSTGGSSYYYESLTKYLFDTSGLRRSLLVNSGVGGYSGAYQGASLATGPMRVHIISERYQGSTDANLFYRLTRSADGYFWNDSTAGWQIGSVDNPFTPQTVGGTPKDTYSKVIPALGTTQTLTLYVYCQGGDGCWIYYASLWWGLSVTGGASSSGVDMKRPPFITTTAAAYEGQDILTIANPVSAPSWRWDQGTGFITFTSAFDNADMEAGGYTGAVPTKARVLAMNYLDASNNDTILYYKGDATTSYVVFKRRVGGSDYAVSIPLTSIDRIFAGNVVKIAWRWQSTGGELGGANQAAKLFYYRVETPLTATGTLGTVAPSGTSTIYLGCGHSAQPDGWIRDVEIVPYVLPDTEIYRRMGV